jgi:hypothetical protein
MCEKIGLCYKCEHKITDHGTAVIGCHRMPLDKYDGGKTCPLIHGTVPKLIQKWRDRRKAIINPDGFTWDDIGFDEPPEGYSSVDEYLENDPEQERDAEDQIELRIIDEVLEDFAVMVKRIQFLDEIVDESGRPF